MKVSISKANMERNLFQQQMERMKHELDQADRDRHAVRLFFFSLSIQY